MGELGVPERRACRVLGQHRSTQRRMPTRPDDEAALRADIVALATEFGRYGYRRITALLERAGWLVNHKRVERLYAEAGLQVRRRKRKKIPMAHRQPLGRPQTANQVWSMDFIFDRTAEGRSIKSLTVVDDATHEAVAIVPERAIGGEQLVRILDGLAAARGVRLARARC
jgi:transposase InsO family protein